MKAETVEQWAQRVVDECAPEPTKSLEDLVCVVMCYETGGGIYRALACGPTSRANAIAIGDSWTKTGFSVTNAGVVVHRVAARAVLGYELKTQEQVMADYARAGMGDPFND